MRPEYGRLPDLLFRLQLSGIGVNNGGNPGGDGFAAGCGKVVVGGTVSGLRSPSSAALDQGARSHSRD